MYVTNETHPSMVLQIEWNAYSNDEIMHRISGSKITSKVLRCEIYSYQGGDYEDYWRLECDAV
jgi:hypothetical protein